MTNKRERGRPKKVETDEQIVVRLPRDLFDELQRRKDLDPEKNRSLIVRKALRAWFAFNPPSEPSKNLPEQGKNPGNLQEKH